MNLVVKNLSKTYQALSGVLFGEKKSIKALDDASFTLSPGESLGIVGESGSGKTTLVKILAGFLSPDGGSAMFGGENLLSLEQKKRAQLVQMVFQDPFSSLNPKLLLGSQILEALKSRGDRTPQQSADQLMKDVGLEPGFLQRYPHQLSGGQRQRFAIARALAMEPRFLLADEPVSSLDVSVQAQIINLLNALRKARGFTQIVISHDLAVIANTCDRVLVMKDGRIMEEGTVTDVIEHPKHPYTQRLLEAAPAL